jgi:capsular polysaccharide biosynthesis protein
VTPPASEQQASAPGFGEGGFEPYVRALRKRPVLVAMVTLAALLGGCAWLLVRSTPYRATAKLMVTPAAWGDATYGGLPVLKDTAGDPTRGMQTAASMIDLPGAAVAAARELPAGWSASRVRAALTIAPQGGSNVLTVQASTADPSVSARMANTFVIAALAERRELLRRAAANLIALLKSAPHIAWSRVALLVPVSLGFDPSFALLSRASTAVPAVGIPAWRVLATALIAGLMLGVSVALLIDRRPRRRGGRDASEEPAASVLAARSSEAGKGIVRPLPRREDAPSG